MPSNQGRPKRSKKPRSVQKNIRARLHTAHNKIKRINRALEFAGDGEIQKLKERLDFWKQQLRGGFIG